MKNRIDAFFRKCGEEQFGKEAMNQVSDERVEKARIAAMNDLTSLIRSGRKINQHAAKKIFCWYLKYGEV